MRRIGGALIEAKVIRMDPIFIEALVIGFVGAVLFLGVDVFERYSQFAQVFGPGYRRNRRAAQIRANIARNRVVLGGEGRCDATQYANHNTVGLLADPVVTPIPAALPLFATGLGALGLLGWRKKRRPQAAA